ncbi:hypothetical protein [Desertivirga xinjiangensis]|uniref:hypothetical protein n=1 Tax=Desertivirga xinjiangensis TaxID=539206 RepID=UPI00210C2613|nr:hypothetical protein [Pedobacter xinjiangensis]
MKLRLASIIMLLFIMFGCKKDKDDATDFLTSKTWKMGIRDKNPSSRPPGLFTYHSVPTCIQDDIYHFKKDGVLEITRNGEKCDEAELSKVVLSYSYNRENGELIIDGVKYVIFEHSAQQIKYYGVLPHATGYDYNVYMLQ